MLNSPIRLFLMVMMSAGATCLASLDDAAAQERRRPRNPALQVIADDPGLPRVLLLGDSISMGYTVPVRELLEGKANVHRALENCGPTTRGLENLEKWLGDKKWDLIHFNFGLHDLKYMNDRGALVDPSVGRQQVPPAEYEKNLRELVERLKRTGATLLWCTTTPVPEGSSGRIPGDAAKYNEIALKVMKESSGGHQIFIDDLYRFARPRLAEIQRKANVHFTPDGSRRLAEQVAMAISENLPVRSLTADGFRPLFDGKTLEGWEQFGGTAKYSVEDGAIVGTAVPNTPNSFLATKKQYGDFILSLEFKDAPTLNSGVQIRSHVYREGTEVVIGGKSRKKRPGTVFGYQVEIDPDMERARLWSGGIYDESRRGWLNDLADNEPARLAFRPGAWNRFRIVAIGDSIRTWINGVPAADLVDSMTLSGFIALQVHGIGRNQERAGSQVRWRNVRIKDLGESTWTPIFDGRTLNGWSALPGGKWEVRDGVIVGTSTREERRHGLLVSDKTYADFTVRLKFRAVKGNSGFYFRAEKVDGAVGVHGFQAEVEPGYTTGGLYETGGRTWVVQTDEDTMKNNYTPGEWTDMSVSAHGRRVVVHVNGHRTADLRNDPGRTEGHLALQLHGGQDMHVEFKQIELLSTPAR